MSVKPGGNAVIPATFFDNGNPLDPVALQVVVRQGATVVAGPFTYPDPVLIRQATGSYVLSWPVPMDLLPGTYEAYWTATLVPDDPEVAGSDLFLVEEASGTVAGSVYATLGQARAAGAVGTDSDVVAAIDRATARVEMFTGDYFTPRTLTVHVTTGQDGRALLPHRVTSPETITLVTVAQSGATVSAGGYVVSTSGVPGDVDALGVGRGWVGANILIAGMEPWAPRPRGEVTYRVTGLFGWPEPPADVQEATATLAAWFTTQLVATDQDGQTSVQMADPEGNVLPVVPPFTDEDAPLPVEGRRTTGLRTVDALLLPYRRERLFQAV